MKNLSPGRAFLAAIAALSLFASVQPASAQYTGPGAGGAPSGGNVVQRLTVREALALTHKTDVSIEGQIARRVSHEHYVLRDATGEMQVEIDDKYFPPGRHVDENARVRLTGKIDRHRHRPNDLDVKAQVEILGEATGQ